MKTGTALIWTVVVVCLIGLVGCGGGGNDNNQPANNGGTVTGEVYGRSGGTFVPLGGQTVSIGNRSTTSDATTGAFVLTGIPVGDFTVVVTPEEGYGDVLNPDILEGKITREGQTVDIGRVLLGEKPPDPGL
jgi:hypothetical protein